MNNLLLRFVVGGVVVSAFAVLGDLFKPKSFAGLFAAAPSLALATLALTIVGEGVAYTTLEARSMIGGAIAFCAYASCVSYVLMRYRLSASMIASLFVLLWLVLSIAMWAVWLR